MPRRRFPRLAGPIPHAGGWGLPGPGIRRPRSAPVGRLGATSRLAIRPGEGTATGVISAAGTLTLSLGPDGLTVWYLTYAAIQTSSGADDASTAQAVVGPVGAGIVPGGQSYAGGGDSIGLGGQRLAPGDYLTIAWSGGNPGDTAKVTVYGSQDVPSQGGFVW